jgi:lipoyl(octanoyl) transferase
VSRPLRVRWLGLQPYPDTWTAMREFTDRRDPATLDEVWLLQHPPVFTQGLAGKPEHVLAAGDIPVIQTDRGGQVTYHGPGQLVVYPLLDLERLQLGVRCLVDRLEQVVIDLLADHGLTAERREGAPGVYVDGAKIASIGLKVRRGCTYHGLALNIDNDLGPFGRINPCGYAGQPMTRMIDRLGALRFDSVAQQLLERLCDRLGLDALDATVDDAGHGHRNSTAAWN